jgi:hypothetical protein
MNKLKNSYLLEKFIIKTWVNTIKRDPKKYLSVVIKSYLMWILKIKEFEFQNPMTKKDISITLMLPRVSQWIRLSYFFGRAIDDIVDGDIPIPDWYNDITEYITTIKNDILQNNIASNIMISKVCQKIIETYKKYDKDIQKYAIDFFFFFLLEYYRRKDKLILNKEQLINLHDKSFRGAHEIYLCALWSKNRQKDISELPQILWRLYGIKDLSEDLSKNICNIPSELWIGIPEWKTELENMLNNETIQKRVIETIQTQNENIKKLRWRYNSLDKSSKIICEWLLPELDWFINNFDYEIYKKEQTSKWIEKSGINKKNLVL